MTGRTSLRLRRGVAGALAAGLAAAGSLVAGATPAAAAATPTAVTNATLAWGFSGEQGGGAFFGGCNFLSAGKAGNTGSSRLWTAADGFYKTVAGNVTVDKPNAAGAYVRPTWATKCQTPQGTPVSSASATSLTRNRVVFKAGTGTVNRTANTATLRWTGSVTSVFYGGLTYWTAANPVLTVKADRTAVLTATASGYGADRDNPGKWVALAPRTITLANLRGVRLTATGFTVTPNYVGVKVAVPSGSTPQAAKTAANTAYWGAFPQSFVDFAQRTGQSSYWFTSGGTRDPAKKAAALTVGYRTTAAAVTVRAAAPVTNAPAASATPTPAVSPAAPAAVPTFTPSVTPAPTAPSASAAPASGGRLVLAQGTASKGSSVAFTAGGFAPGETVRAVMYSDPVELASLTADAKGVVSSSRTIPLNVPAGSHHLVLTGATSGATASSALTVTPLTVTPLTVTSRSNTLPAAPSAAGTRSAPARAFVAAGQAPALLPAAAAVVAQPVAAASCTPTSSVTGGNLVWGFKRSFRSYVAGASGTSITASSGASILAQDLAIAGKANSGAYRFPFASTVTYGSATDFTVRYGGSVELRYPAHYFVMVIANPKVTVKGGTGTLYADVTLTNTPPGAAASTSARTGIALASLTAAAPVTSANGTTRALQATLLDTQAFQLNGSAFYQKGQALDDATVLLAGCAGSGNGDQAGVTPANTDDPADTGNDSLIPDVTFRGDADDTDGAGADAVADALPFTGFDLQDALAVAACACAAGLLFLTAATRRRPVPAGEKR